MNATAQRFTIDKIKPGALPPRVQLTPVQARAWTETCAALLTQCPAFAHIFYSLMSRRNGSDVAYFTTAVPIAATDGDVCFINPETFFKYPLGNRVFAVAHEILHCMLNHCGLMATFRRAGGISYADGTRLPFDGETFNIALDLVINAMLIEAKVGKFHTDWLHDPAIAKGDDSAIDVYRKIFAGGGGGGGGGGSGDSSGRFPGKVRFDEHLDPGASAGQTAEQGMAERSETEWRTEIAAAISSARMQGKLPANLARVFGELVEPPVDWREHIRALFARKVGSGGYDWRRPDRRLITRSDPIYAPSRSGNGCGVVVVGGDTSGSINDNILNVFFGAIAGILNDLNPRLVLVAWCDAKLHRVDELETPSDLDTVRYNGAPGGGGTSFVPVFDWLDDAGIVPDALVYLTDGFGAFPSAEPAYPVIWGSITPAGRVKYPFGDVVQIPV